MGMMARMRDLAPAFIITVGVLFVLFMVIADSQLLENFGGPTQNVGTVNGKDITFQEFSNFVDRAAENQKAQTGQDIELEQMDQFRDQVWDAIVTQTLTEQQIKKFGIVVADQEIRDVIISDNPPEFLRQNFIDSLGRFNREAYETAIFDARNKDALIEAEEVVRQQLLSQKLQSYLWGTVNIGEGELRKRFTDQNIRMTAEFALVETNLIGENEITFTEDEIKKFYNDNPEKFTAEAQRKLKYVVFSVAASSKDSSLVRENLENVSRRLLTDTASFASFVSIYSELPHSIDTMTAQQLPANLVNTFLTSSAGAVIGPVQSQTGYGIYKLVNRLSGTEMFARASHILIQASGDDAKDLAEANRIYDELIKGADFASLAIQHSKDPGSGQKGGDLGWFGRGQMVAEFDNASFNGPLNVVQKPIKTSFGYHIVKVTGRTNTRFVVEKIVNNVKISATTRDNIFNSANDFVYLAQENGFEKEAQLANFQVLETPEFNEKAFSVPGIGVNKRLIDFAFNNSVNEVSPVFKVNQNFIVAMVSDVIKAGVKKFEDVKEEAKLELIKEKKFQKAKEISLNIKNHVGGNLFRAREVFQNALIDSSVNFSTSGSIPNIGMEFNVSHTALTLPLNTVSEPIKGYRGYYLIKVVSRTEFDNNLYQQQRNSLIQQLIQEKRSYLFNQWMNSMKENAEIIDNRHLFYGY